METETLKSFLKNCNPQDAAVSPTQNINTVINDRAILMKRADREFESHVKVLKFYFGL